MARESTESSASSINRSLAVGEATLRSLSPSFTVKLGRAGATNGRQESRSWASSTRPSQSTRPDPFSRAWRASRRSAAPASC